LLALLVSLIVTGVALADETVTIVLPPDAQQFRPGPGQALAQANCIACHAADYVYVQPPLTRSQWNAEVLKMRTAYGAKIPDDAVDPLVAYLVSQNGKP
jgi:mono/diheme cytochrome c family protein